MYSFNICDNRRNTVSVSIGSKITTDVYGPDREFVLECVRVTKKGAEFEFYSNSTRIIVNDDGNYLNIDHHWIPCGVTLSQ